jgi:hypothetical protein
LDEREVDWNFFLVSGGKGGFLVVNLFCFS